MTAEVEKRKAWLPRIEERLKAVEKRLEEIADGLFPPKRTETQVSKAAQGGEATVSGRVASERECLLCGSINHKFANCAKYPTASHRSAEFGRRKWCKRCAKPNCHITTCDDPHVVCRKCQEAGIRDKRSVHHLTEVCDEVLRMKAIKKMQEPTEKSQKRPAANNFPGGKRRAAQNPVENAQYMPLNQPGYPMVYYMTTGLPNQMVPGHPQQMQMMQQPMQQPMQQVHQQMYQTMPQQNGPHHPQNGSGFINQ
uniref:CCHC-type domain-containing protein n=1 Tax=Caenorhabditis tropicalis TaxID=1561998 RepID=A0A1I7T9M6_9PELO